MSTLLVLVVISSIAVLFADETSAFVKKWYEVYWVRVTVPLLVISWIWAWNDELLPVFLEWLQGKCIFLIAGFASWLPTSLQWVGDAFGLFLLASLPAWILYWRFRRDVVTASQANIVASVYAYAWVFFAVLLLS